MYVCEQWIHHRNEYKKNKDTFGHSKHGKMVTWSGASNRTEVFKPMKEKKNRQKKFEF